MLLPERRPNPENAPRMVPVRRLGEIRRVVWGIAVVIEAFRMSEGDREGKRGLTTRSAGRQDRSEACSMGAGFNRERGYWVGA